MRFIVWWRQKKSDLTLNYLVYPKKEVLVKAQRLK